LDWNLEEVTEEHILLSQHVDGGYKDHLIPWAAIASWGELLGVPDSDIVLEAILREAHEATEETDWAALYAARRESLPTPQPVARLQMRSISAAPPLETLVTVQARARQRLGLDAPRVLTLAETTSPINTALADHQDAIDAHADSFREYLQPNPEESQE